MLGAGGVHHRVAGLDDDGLLGKDEDDGAAHRHDAQRLVRRVEDERSGPLTARLPLRALTSDRLLVNRTTTRRAPSFDLRFRRIPAGTVGRVSTQTIWPSCRSSSTTTANG